MEFWSDLSKKIANAADYTAKETEKFTNIAKIKYKISGLKSKRDQLYKNIGKMKYAEYCGENTEELSYTELLEEISHIYSEIGALEEQIALLKKYKICQTCRTKIDRDMLFCPRCGAKVSTDSESSEQESSDKDELILSNAGSDNKDNSDTADIHDTNENGNEDETDLKNDNEN